MDDPARASGPAEYAAIKRSEIDREPSTQMALRALEEANGRLDKLVGILTDKLDVVLLETAPEDTTLMAAVRDPQSRLGAQLFVHVDAMHRTADRIERILARIDL